MFHETQQRSRGSSRESSDDSFDLSDAASLNQYGSFHKDDWQGLWAQLEELGLNSQVVDSAPVLELLFSLI